MTKYEKIMEMNIEQLAKFLKEFSSSTLDWRDLRALLESDGEVLNYD